VPGQRRRRWIAGAAAVLALVGVSGWLWRHLSPRDPPPPAVAQLTSYPGSELDPALSPDGRQVAFAWNGEKGDNSDIYLQMIDGGGQPLRLTTDPAVDGFAVWSPDGRQLAFRRQSGAAVGLYVVPALAARAARR